jgi:hypothetical protein
MTDNQHFTAETTAHPKAADHRWAIVYDATPGGRDNGDGTRSYSLRFPILLLTDYVHDPEIVAKSVAKALNEARMREDAANASAA